MEAHDADPTCAVCAACPAPELARAPAAADEAASPAAAACAVLPREAASGAPLAEPVIAAAHAVTVGDTEARCRNVDARTRKELGERLLHCIAAEMVHRSVGEDDALAELQKAVLPPGEIAPEAKGVFGLALLQQRIDKVAAKKSFSSAMAGVFTHDQLVAKVDSQARELERSGALDADVRDRLASILIRHYDLAHQHWCGFDLSSLSPADIECHDATCPFREVQCPNPCCPVSNSAHEMRGHDATCPCKLVPCPRGCGSDVARKAIDKHVESSCGSRPVICPFQRVGCRVGCTQAELEEHLASHSTEHMVDVLGRLDAQQQQLECFAAQLLDTRTRAHAAEAEVAAAKRDVAKLSKEVVAVEKEFASVEKTVAQHGTHISRVDEAVSKLALSHGSGEKELRASLDKLASEHARVKGTLDTLMNKEAAHAVGMSK
ncbi:hypothetical protein KFE25_008944 [Diacronema lutheri]|uniref:TRAF-type domain-containing protein n=1 Tax=Diacronema lutheri TaxID=2081491 RepID=A0A8J5XLY7_DIALT|nr:hypothetical protein KFE25_008944 [Diacronema lutheri]